MPSNLDGVTALGVSTAAKMVEANGRGVWVYAEPAQSMPAPPKMDAHGYGSGGGGHSQSASAHSAPAKTNRYTSTSHDTSLNAEEDLFEGTALKLESAFLQKKIRKVEATLDVRIQEVLQQVNSVEGNTMKKLKMFEESLEVRFEEVTKSADAAAEKLAGGVQTAINEELAKLRAVADAQLSAVADMSGRLDLHQSTSQKHLDQLRRQIEQELQDSASLKQFSELRREVQQDLERIQLGLDRQSKVPGQIEDIKTFINVIRKDVDMQSKHWSEITSVKDDLAGVHRDLEAHGRVYSQVDDLRTGLDDLVKEVSAQTWRSDVDRVEKQLDGHRLALDKLQDFEQGMISLREDIDAQQKVAIEFKEMRRLFKIQQRSLPDKLDALGEDLASVRREQDKHRGVAVQSEKLEQDVTTLRDELCTALSVNSSVGNQVEGLHQMLAGLRSQVDSQPSWSSHFDELSRDMDGMRDVLTGVQRGLETTQNDLALEQSQSRLGMPTDSENPLGICRLQISMNSLEMRQAAEEQQRNALEREVQSLQQQLSNASSAPASWSAISTASTAGQPASGLESPCSRASSMRAEPANAFSSRALALERQTSNDDMRSTIEELRGSISRLGDELEAERMEKHCVLASAARSDAELKDHLSELATRLQNLEQSRAAVPRHPDHNVAVVAQPAPEEVCSAAVVHVEACLQTAHVDSGAQRAHIAARVAQVASPNRAFVRVSNALPFRTGKALDASDDKTSSPSVKASNALGMSSPMRAGGSCGRQPLGSPKKRQDSKASTADEFDKQACLAMNRTGSAAYLPDEALEFLDGLN